MYIIHWCMFLCIAWTINIPCSRCKSKILPPKLGKFVVGIFFFKKIFALFCKILPSTEHIFQPVWAFVISECQRKINIVSAVFTVFLYFWGDWIWAGEHQEGRRGQGRENVPLFWSWGNVRLWQPWFHQHTGQFQGETFRIHRSADDSASRMWSTDPAPELYIIK